MPSVRCYVFSALAAAVSLASAGDVCNAFGIDFVDGQSYFINTLSNDDFTFVTQFEGCNAGIANTEIVNPSGDEILCSDINTTPDDTPEMATCPIEKSQMVSGLWTILVMGDNGNGDPFAYERDVTLDCGPQVTATVTPTVTYNITITPIATATVIQTVTNTTTFGPTTTYTIPSKTAAKTKTITPNPVTVTKTQTITRHQLTWTKTQTIKTSTVTASCTVPPKPQWPDKTCTYTPTLLHPKALETGYKKKSKSTKWHWRGTVRAVDVTEARSRIEAAKLRREMKERAAVQVEERAPDAPTIYVTYSVAVNVTSTYTAATTTTTETDLTTTVVSTTLPPATVYSGIYTSTVTLPTMTKTKQTIKYTTLYTTKTIHATWTLTKTVTPTASAAACKKRGGHWGFGRW